MDNLLKINAMNYIQKTSPELVAKQLGLTRQTIHNLKSGRKNLRLIYCLAIAFLTRATIFNNVIKKGVEKND